MESVPEAFREEIIGYGTRPSRKTRITLPRSEHAQPAIIGLSRNNAVYQKEDQHVKTALLEGKKPAHFDKHIIGNLLLDVAPPDEVREEKMLIGVRNEAGEIYRLIGATKLNSFMNAVEELFDLGLVDELEDTEEPKDGCDAIFSEP
jgi:hypothetical protein